MAQKQKKKKLKITPIASRQSNKINVLVLGHKNNPCTHRTWFTLYHTNQAASWNWSEISYPSPNSNTRPPGCNARIYLAQLTVAVEAVSKRLHQNSVASTLVGDN